MALACACFVAILPRPAISAPAAPIRLAIAPFEGETAAWPVADAFHAELAKRSLERVLAPGSFVAEQAFAPDPAAIRRWAYNAAVDHVVVGRIAFASRDGEPVAGGADRRLEVVLHSGHSGAEISRHAVGVGARGELDTVAARLANAVLADLGYEAPRPQSPSTPPAATSASGGETASASSGRGLDAKLELGGFENDAPIEIKADEAEIVSRGEGRELVFQHNVFVRQANVTLRSDRLAASYRKGESEPRRLVAEGQVRVDQGDRRARCDEAIYERELQQLICRGHAELVQGCDVVRGDSIEFDLADDRARVEGAASIVIRPDDESGAACTPVGGVL